MRIRRASARCGLARAFNDFATCPLPPPQNRLAVRVEAGELTYDRYHLRE